MNQKKARKLRQEAGYEAGRDPIKNRQYANQLTGKRCLGSRRRYRELKKGVKNA